ncbi:MAG TPA: outer membrane beta-barrel protein [Blastocatellia bacterium]|nr:outer membrane beta-barrel protein [Blastocatellia bacterium]
MPRTLLIACLLFLPLTAKAQEQPRAEVFGGYSFFHTDGGGNLHGWNASVAGNLNKWFGVVADFSGHYGSESFQAVPPEAVGPFPPLPRLATSIDSNLHLFLAGPRLSYREHDRLIPFGHLLLGVARSHVDGKFEGSTFIVRFNDTSTAFSMALGGGLDVKLSGRVALRLIQADYLLTRFNDNTQHNARISVGVVFRFGMK